MLFALAGLNLSGQPATWFTDGKFGLFLHWGLYSQTAGDWNGHPTKGVNILCSTNGSPSKPMRRSPTSLTPPALMPTVGCRWPMTPA
ncbi:alpha-L-fucosidase [Sphingobacterium sp. E70]|uniref:alpha-L-fucosidase n=1 Tax=Sphingobacterium sp. E70 TaxID=2853439 RepID=UPI00211BC0FB|nr:alpha-L-fucosidase [Sphingobacterium sp. E70]